MSQLLTFEQTSKLIRFPNSVFHHLGRKSDKDEDIKNTITAAGASLGIVTTDGHIAALAKGPNLDVVYLEVNEQLAAWTFAPIQDFIPQITCLIPFNQTKNFQRNSLILVGLDCGPESGAICLFDTASSKLIRYIVLPQPVTSLTVVLGWDGPAGTPGFLHPALRYLNGVVAVGMVQGCIYLIDLALDETLPASSDTEPAGIVFIDPYSKEISRCRNETLAHGNHVAIDLTTDLNESTFIWQDSGSDARSSPSQKLEYQFPSEEIQVSCLNFNNFNATLAVGYNIGTWKLISLVSLQIDHSSSYSRSENTVTHISFQEPENDPRNYVYYWVVRSDTEESVQGLAVATLYSLTYKNKQQEYIGDEVCPLYTDLEILIPRFEHVLGGEDSPNYSWCVNMYTLQLDSTCSQEDSPSEPVSPPMDNGLNVIIWKAGVDYKTAATYLGIFDMNAWYQAQMPSLFSVDDGDDLCSYFSHSLLEDPDGASGGILDVTVFRDSVARFTGSPGPILEQHCYPSSLKYDIVVLTKDGYLTATQLGIQRRVLAELSSKLSVLVQPTQMYQICLMTGLAGGNMEPSLLAQREVLMNIALEHNMVGLIVSAVFDWADGKYSKSGCSLKFVMDWALKRVATLKHKLDSTSVPLFDYSLGEADKTCLQLLNQISGEFSQILSILTSIEEASGPVTQLGLEQLETRKIVTGLLLLYTQAITWFVNAGLLPEQPEGSRANPYPFGYLMEMYRSRRRSMGQLPRTFGKPCLLVDLLCEDIGDDLIKCFQKSGGVGDYPPPSLHGLLSVFLAPASAPSKLRLVQYLFLDLAQVLNPEIWNDLVDKLIKFPSAFSLPPSIIKLTQAFWLLDHGDFEESVTMLLDPLLKDDDVTPEHHRAILTALLCQGQHSLALDYTQLRRPPMLDHRDIQLHMNVLLQNGSIQAAYTFQKSHQAYSGSSELLQQIFEKAEELNKLESVLKLYLTKQEESQLVRFLQQSKKTGSQEVLMLYYLQRSRYTEAYQLNQNLRSRQVSTPAMDAIMDRYCSILPSIGPSAQLLLSKLPGGGRAKNQLPEAVSVKTLPGRSINLASRASRIEAQLATPRRHVPSETPFRSKTKSFLLSESSLESAKKRKLTHRPTMEFMNESLEKTVEKIENKKDTSGDIVTPPGKRTRINDEHSSLSMSTRIDFNPSRLLHEEFRDLLQTPTIVRKTVSTTRGEHHINLDQTSHTPHSILKVKNLIQENSPALDDSINDYPGGSNSIIPHHETRTSYSRETTPNKSLRFKVPKKLPPSGPAGLKDNMPSSEASTTIFSPSLRSPVAELATSSDAEISFQIPVNRVDQPQFSRLKVRNISENSHKSSEGDSFHSMESPLARSRAMETSGDISRASLESPGDRSRASPDASSFSQRSRLSDSLRASVEEAERGAKAVLAAAAKDEAAVLGEAAKDDGAAAANEDEGEMVDDDETEEAPKSAAEIQKAVEDLDQDVSAEDTLEDKAPEESVIEEPSLEETGTELDWSDIPYEDETRVLFPELKSPTPTKQGDTALKKLKQELKESMPDVVEAAKAADPILKLEKLCNFQTSINKIPESTSQEDILKQALEATVQDTHTPDTSVLDDGATTTTTAADWGNLPNFSQIMNVTTSEEDLIQTPDHQQLDTPNDEELKSVNQSQFNFSEFMNITTESEDLEASEVELSAVGAATTAVASSEPVIVVDDNKAEEDIIIQLDTTQDTEEDSIQEIIDDASTIQQSMGEELVDKHKGATEKVVEFVVENEVSSEVIEIVDDTKQEDIEKHPNTMKATSVAKKISQTFSYDSATATITPTRKTIFARTQEIEGTKRTASVTFIEEEPQVMSEAIEVVTHNTEAHVDEEATVQNASVVNIAIIPDYEESVKDDDILSTISEKGSDKNDDIDDVISVGDAPEVPSVEAVSGDSTSTGLDLPFRKNEDELRDLLEEKAIDVNKGDMREMLETISTTATRASSVAGSMWSEAPAEISFTEGSVEASLLGREDSEDNSAAVSADASFTEEAVDACSYKGSAPAIVQVSAVLSVEPNLSKVADQTDLTEAFKSSIEEATQASSTETTSKAGTGYDFAEAEVLGSGAEATEADPQNAQEYKMRSPENTELDIVEDMDYEESHIEVTEEDQSSTQVQGNVFAPSDDAKVIEEENVSKVSKMDGTQVLAASTVPEKLPEVGLDKTQVLEASAILEHSTVSGTPASGTPAPDTPAGGRIGIAVGMVDPVTPGFPRMSAPRAVPVPSQGEEFCVPDHALDFSVPTILEIEDNEDGDDQFKDNFLFSQPHDLSMEDIDEDDLQEDNINKERENDTLEVHKTESMAVEISEKMVEGEDNQTNKLDIEEKEEDKIDVPSIDAVDAAVTVDKTVESTNVVDKVDIVVDTADKQEKVVEEAVEELVAKADTTANETEKQSDGSLLIIGARRSRRRLSPRSAKSTPKRGSQVTRATVDQTSDADSNSAKAAVQSPSTRSRASKSVKSQRGAAKAVLAHIDQMLAGLTSSSANNKEVVKDKQVTPEAKTTRKGRESSVKKGTPSRQASATPTRGQSARKASATPTRSSARKPSATPTRSSARKVSVTPTRSSARKASVTPTRSSARKASVTPTRSSARKTSATPTRTSVRKASATPTRPSSATPSKNIDETKSPKLNIKKKLAKTPDIEDANKSTTTPIRKSTRKFSVVLSPSSALLRPSSTTKITRRSTIAVGVPILTPNTPSRKSKRLDSVTPSITEEVGTPTRRSSRASSATKKASEHEEPLTKIDVAKRNLTDEPMEQEQAPLATPTRRSSRLESGSPISTPGDKKSGVKESESASKTRSGRKAVTPGTPKGKKLSPSTPARRASRRISGTSSDVVLAPDGGIITGSGRRGKGTPRAKQRHSAVRKEDVEKALGLTVSVLEPVPEDKEIAKADLVESDNEEEQTEEKPKPRGRGKRSTVTIDSSLTAESGATLTAESGAGLTAESGASLEGASGTEEGEESTKPKRGRPKRSMIMLKRGEGLLFSEEADYDEDAPSLKEILESKKVKTKYVARKRKSTVRRIR